MKERPILMNSEMVCAILDGRKTQTRRIIKIPPPGRLFEKYECWNSVHFDGEWTCPFGQPGDQLWVRETFCPDWCDSIIYKADGGSAKEAGYSKEPRWTPSIHMPRRASRILLEITNVRVERLQDISEADALAEGVTLHRVNPSRAERMARDAYQMLWESINGPGSWDANPWVWMIEFKHIDAKQEGQ